MPEMVVTDKPAEGRFDATIDGAEVGFVEYRLSDGHIILTYIEIEPALRGNDLGARLADIVLEECRARGHKVTPRCGFIAAHMRANPDYEDLLAR